MTPHPSDARHNTVHAVENLLLEAAEDIQIQQEEIRNRFPRMTALPPSLNVDPNSIRSFTQSDVYKKAVADYLNCRTYEHLLITVLRLLREFLPTLIGSI